MTSTTQRRQQLGAFYAANQHRLERALARRMRANRELIEDACATAWAILARRPDITLDARGLGWLTTVAFNEALRLINHTSGEFAPPRRHARRPRSWMAGHGRVQRGAAADQPHQR